MLLGLYFFIVIALPLALGSYVFFHGLPRTRRCPGCADGTVRLRSRGHALASRFLHGSEVHARWCMRCGWQGTVRLEEATIAMRREPGTGSTRHPDRVDLRTLRVDGDTWRVMVECWAEGGRWLARLVFIAPTGQVCHDARSLEGASVLAVISQAFRLPEQTLAGRLRRSIR
jgi:hypothetical protein